LYDYKCDQLMFELLVSFLFSAENDLTFSVSFRFWAENEILFSAHFRFRSKTNKLFTVGLQSNVLSLEKLNPLNIGVTTKNFIHSVFFGALPL